MACDRYSLRMHTSPRAMHTIASSSTDRVKNCDGSFSASHDEHPSSMRGVDHLEDCILTPEHGVLTRNPRFMNSELTDPFDHRISRSSIVLPRSSSSTCTPTHSAIPAQNSNRNTTNSQDVSSFVNSSASYLSSPVTRSEANAHYLGPSVHSHTAQNVLNNRRQRLRTSNQVFTSPHGVTPYGLPHSLPPAPSTTPRRSQPEPEPNFSHSTFPDFASMSSNYLNMLAQKPDNMSASDNAAVSRDLDSFDVAGDLMGIVDVINGEYLVPSETDEQDTECSPASAPVIPPTPETPELWTSPDFVTLGDEFLNTSPFSPDLDNLNTPLIGTDDMLTGMFDTAVTGDLFAPMDFADYEYEKPVVPSTPAPLPDNLYTMTPESPALHDFNPSIDPSAVYSKSSEFSTFPHPTQSTTSVSRNALGLEGAVPKVPESVLIPNRRRTSATGTRKGVTPDALVPPDAPTQPRKYITPSVTSRKEVPSIFAKKRSRSTAFGEEDDEFINEPPLPPNATEKEMIEYKRRQNTVAARRSRKRKLQYQQDLEQKLERMSRERDVWKTRAEMFQDMLVANGVQFSFQDSIDDQ